MMLTGTSWLDMVSYVHLAIRKLTATNLSLLVHLATSQQYASTAIKHIVKRRILDCAD